MFYLFLPLLNRRCLMAGCLGSQGSGSVCAIYRTKSRGFSEISCTEICHREIDSAPTPPPPSENALPQWLGTSNATQTRVYTQKHQRAHYSTFVPNTFPWTTPSPLLFRVCCNPCYPRYTTEKSVRRLHQK